MIPVARRVRLISAIAHGRRWLDEIMTGSITDAEQLAKRERRARMFARQGPTDTDG
jgi:hypothetical protein